MKPDTIYVEDLQASQPRKVTDTFVQNLKRQAKALKRAPGVSHCHALNMVAAEAGFENWQAVVHENTEYRDSILATGSATVHFEDHGQDFLRWHIKASRIVGCEPFQASVWCGREVLSIPKVGGRICIRASDGTELWIKYPVSKVEEFCMTVGEPA